MQTCPRCQRTYDEGVRFCPTDGTEVVAVDPYLGKVLMGQFHLTAVAGQGAMGTVYRAEQTTMGRQVAVKMLRQDLLRETQVVRRFLREGRAAARLSHPNIVTVHLVGETEHGVPYIVMELIEGESLAALCEREGALSPPRALAITRQIASALVEAHAQGIVHRDLKPENILLSERGRAVDQVKVLDFGIAKILPRQGVETMGISRDGAIFGTPHYISPEQAAGQEVDARSDLYSLGVLLFRMVCGRLPFEGTSGMQVLLRHLREEPPRPRTIRPELPPALDEIILRALAKQPGDRFADAEQLLAAIDGLAVQLGGDAAQTRHGVAPAPRTSSPQPPPPQLRTPPHGEPSPAPVVVATPSPRATPPPSVPDEPADGDQVPIAAAVEATERVESIDDYMTPPPQRRRLLWGLGAVVAGILGGLFWASRPPARSFAAADGGVSAARDLGPALGPWFGERVIAEGKLVARLGFATLPREDSRVPLMLTLRDEKGALAEARLTVELRGPGGREELLEGRRAAAGLYAVEVPFAAAGRYRLRVVVVAATTTLRGALEVDLEARGAPVTSRPPPSRPPRPRPGSEDFDVVVVPPSSAAEPLTPRAIGPGPGAAAAPAPASPPEAPLAPASPPPPSPSPVAPPAATPATTAAPVEGGAEVTEGDPYKVLDRR